MKIIKIILFCLILILLAEAAGDRSIYRKKHGNENKVALVIGNSKYTHFSPLKNTLNDAEDMQKILKTKGFDVLYLKDGNLRSMKKIVRKFSKKLKQGGVGFFYYAGHGLEVAGKNYLIPIGAEMPEQDEVEFESLPVDMIINKMENSHNRLNIIVLDACRNDPFNRGGGGLAQINNAKGMYIAFATGPGEVASDGRSGRNGLFTKYLIKYINQPNLTLNEVFDKTRTSVHQESDEKQLPWTSSSVIGSFYFQADAASSSPLFSSLFQSNEMEADDKAELVRLRQMKKQQTEAEQAELARLKKEEAARRKSATQNNYALQNSQNMSSSSQHNQPYVCYDKKYLNGNKPIYSGCVRSKRSCKSISKYHFGRYPNDRKAHSAFVRCSSGSPKFIDSQGQAGTRQNAILSRETRRRESSVQNSRNFSSSSQHNQPYVCYESKYLNRNKPIYNGCVRSKYSCKSIGKYRFGKYPNDRKAHSAFVRCSSGSPKFIDSQGVLK